jgi:hypothetical protein
MFAALAMLSVVPARAAEWKGKIDDNMCKGTHAGGEHDGKKMTSAECVSACVKDHGAKYVFVGEGDKVFKIANQDFADLKAHGGHKVALTGEMKGDSITVSKIAMPAAKPAK